MPNSTKQASKSAKGATKSAKANVDRKPNECLCGCRTRVRHLFAQGHDQRVRGMLQRHAAQGEPLPATLQSAVRKGLVKLLEHVRPNAKVLTAKAA